MNKNNPLAFPVPIQKINPETFIEANCAGMFLRDYFAAKAMQGFAADPHFAGGPVEAANFAYQWADSMLLERSKNDK